MLRLKNCCLDEIQDVLSGKRVYGYGAGVFLDNFGFRNPAVGIEKYLYKLIDKKEGTKILGDKQLQVQTLERIKTEISKEDIILIASSNYYVEMIEEMDGCQKLDGVTCYILPFIENNFSKCKVDWELYQRCRQQEELIPKVIHYCWFGGNDIPEEQKRYMESWKKFCPDYEIVEWSENNYDIKKNQYMYEAYQNQKWAFVSDYARIDILHQYGGIYLDTDVELIRSLDELLHFQGFMGFETGTLVNTGFGYGSVRNHIVLQKTLEKYAELHFLKENGQMDTTACPVIQTAVLERLGLKRQNELQELAENFMVLPTPFLGGMNWGTRKIEVQECTYAIHHYFGSWTKDDGHQQKRKDAAGELLERMKANG